MFPALGRPPQPGPVPIREGPISSVCMRPTPPTPPIPPEPPTPNTPAGGPTIADPLPCVGCGYDLVGLGEDGVCPECGVAIGRSVSGDHLLASSKEHRGKLASGARLAVWGAWAGWVSLGLLAVDLVLDAGIGARPGVRTGPMVLAQVPLWLGMCTAFAFTGLGWIGLTRADPDRIGDGTSTWTRRMLLRGWAVLTTSTGVLFLPYTLLAYAGVWIAITTKWPGGLEVARFGAIAGWPMLAVSGVMAGAIDTLARRLLEGDLAGRSRGLAPMGYTALALLTVALAFDVMPLGGWWWLLEPIAWGLAGVAVLAWAIQYHTLVRALRVALAAVAARP